MHSVVALAHLTRRFKSVTAVDDLSFEVSRGELLGIVGPDGAGKTTTLRMLAGVLRPTSGDATVMDVSISRDPEGVKHHIAYMSQRFGLYADLTVRENLDFYADLYQVPTQSRPRRIERLYQFSQLGPFEQRLAGQLSGGMKQKLSLSCALIHEPDVLLLDEPTFGVDPISRRDLWLIIHEMVDGGMTVIVSTAYLDEAERCDRVVLMHHGRMAANDTPQQLRASLGGRITVLRTDRPRRARDILLAQPAVRQAVLFGDSIHITLTDSERDWPAIRSVLTEAGLAVQSVEHAEPSLEDVFIDLVQSDAA